MVFPGAKTLFDSGVGRDGDLYRLKFFVDFGIEALAYLTVMGLGLDYQVK